MTDFNRTAGTSGAPTTSAADFATPTETDSAFATSTSDTMSATGAKQTLKDEAGKLTAKATDKARGLADEGKARATSALDEFSRMMEDAAGTVDEKLGNQYGQYARSAAQAISGFSDDLRGKEIEDLLGDARDFVRKSPAVAIGTAAALGFILARIVKAGVDTVDTTTTHPVTKA
jgi:ElaB/YqjD/DUF883 family membrane-anchored ribosome-binding protein